MIWIIIAPALALALVAAALFARAAARANKAPQPSGAPILAGDIGPACLACLPGWEPAYILDATVAGGNFIIRTSVPGGKQTGLVLPADVPEALASMSSLLALDDTPVTAEALASAVTVCRAGTVIAIRSTQEALS